MKITVVICAYTMDRFDQVGRCVESILGGALVPDEILVIVDGNPTLRDALRAALPECVTVLDNEGRGLADGRTMALRRSANDVIAYIDDDAWADPEWLTELSQPFTDPGVIGVGGKVVPEWEDGSSTLPPEIYWVIGSTYLGHRVDAGPITRPIGANMAVRRSTLLDLGGFSSSFGRQEGMSLRSNEELAAFTAVTDRFGPECVHFVPTATVHHFAPRQRCSFWYVVRRSRAEGISKADIRRRFGSGTMGHDRSYARQVIPTAIAHHLLSGVRRRDRRSLRSAALIASAFGTTSFSYALRLATAGSGERVPGTVARRFAR